MILRIVLKLITGILLGFLGTLFLAQTDPWAQLKLEKIAHHSLSTIFNCTVVGDLTSCNLIYPHVTFKNFKMTAYDGSWRWSADQYDSGFSWSEFVRTGAIQLWTRLKRVHGDSCVRNNMPAILPHVNDLMKGPELPVPLITASAEIGEATFDFHDGDIKSSIQWECSAKKVGSVFRSRYRLKNGIITRKGACYVTHLAGNVSVDAKQAKNRVEYDMHMNLKCALPHLGEYPLCLINGKWQDNRGRFQIESADRAFRINPLIIVEKDNDWQLKAQATIPLSFLYKSFSDLEHSPFQGTGTFQLQGSLSENGVMEGYAVCEDMRHSWLSDSCVCNGIFTKTGLDLSGSWNIKSGLHHAWRGLFDWNQKKQLGTLTTTNESTLSFPQLAYWSIKPHDARFNLLYDRKENRLDSSYYCGAVHELNDTKIQARGNQQVDNNGVITCDGVIGAHAYRALGSTSYPFITELSIRHNKEKVAEGSYNKAKDQYEASASFSVIQMLCDSLWNYELHGEGKLNCDGNLRNNLFSMNLSFDDATVRLPQTYNFLSSASMRVRGDILKRQFHINELKAGLHSGGISSPEGIVWFDNKWMPTFIHIPLFIDRCLVSAKQDLFAVISGSVLLNKKNEDKTDLSGNILINRAQLKENLFSDQFQKKLFSSMARDYKELPFTCNLSIETKEPIRIDTPFLKANGNVNLHVYGSLVAPFIEGFIVVPSGTIGFPYKPLEISKGEIHFIKEQPLNPLIELTAKNTVKNHHITLSITGSVQDNIVLLEATPPLTQEQIVGLLVAGAHEDSLDALIPALLMKNVTNYILSSHKSNFFDRYIKPWMKQVNVHLKPNFGDQAGRGGLRGTLEITLNERWRALIEKNFTLTEDTHFELEYILSDDITFRMIRDERRDVGGEVEMKWKF